MFIFRGRKIVFDYYTFARVTIVQQITGCLYDGFAIENIKVCHRTNTFLIQSIRNVFKLLNLFIDSASQRFSMWTKNPFSDADLQGGFIPLVESALLRRKR